MRRMSGTIKRPTGLCHAAGGSAHSLPASRSETGLQKKNLRTSTHPVATTSSNW